MINMEHFFFVRFEFNVSALSFSIIYLMRSDLLDCILYEVLTDILLCHETTYRFCLITFVHD